MGCVRLTTLQYNKYFIGRFSISKTILEIRIPQNFIKLRGKDTLKMTGIERGENWSKLGRAGFNTGSNIGR